MQLRRTLTKASLQLASHLERYPYASHPVQACQEFEITQIVKQSEEQEPTQYLTADQKDLTGDFTTKLVDKNQLKKNKQG